MSWRPRISAMSRATNTRFSSPTFSTRSFPLRRGSRSMSSIPTCSAIGASNTQKKRPAAMGRSFPPQTPARGLELLVRCGRRAIDRILGGLLGIAQRLLAFALCLLDRAFALQAIGAGGFADALLGFTHDFVGSALAPIG